MGWWDEFSPEEAQRAMPGYLAWLYFGVEQLKDTGRLSVRGCLAPDDLNACTAHEENIFMAGVDGILSLGHQLQSALGPNVELVMAREDWVNGYFQVGSDPESANLFCATAWDPVMGIRIFRPNRLLFGPARAPFHFCRVETAVLQIVCEMFMVPAVPHVDDNITLETVAGMPSARRAMLVVHEALGFELSPCKAVPCRARLDGSPLPFEELGTGVTLGVALGVEWDWGLTAEERAQGVLVKTRLPDIKASKYDARVWENLQRGRMSSADCKKLSGTVDYVCSAASGKKGRAYARPLRDWENCSRTGRRPLSSEMRASLQSLRPFFKDRGWQPILGHVIARRFAILFSDARGKDHTNWGSEHLAAVLITASGGAYVSISASHPMVAEWLQHVISEQRINECESIAALLGLASFSQLLHDFDVLHFVDSTAAQGVLVKGFSKSQTLCAVTSAYWTLAGKYRVCSWIGRVPSKLNVADGPTRGDLSAVQAHGWNKMPPLMPPLKPWRKVFSETLG